MSESLLLERALGMRPAAVRLVEVAAFNVPRDDVESLGLPSRPGAVSREDGGSCTLYFAPGRWLLVAPSPVSETRVLAASEWGSWVDVTGKWVAMALQGEAAEWMLASTVDLETTLRNRDCAAVTLFDCPSILVREAQGFVVWVRASVADAWVSAVERLGVNGPRTV